MIDEVSNKVVLAVVIPCFNEQESLGATINDLGGCLDQLKQDGVISERSFLYFVDDGSDDGTWALIEEAHSKGRAKGLKLAINYGHQYALLAGLLEARNDADCVISIDADLQDDISLIGPMVKAYKEGYELVYVVNGDRDSDSFLKRTTARIYYRLLDLLQIKIVKDHADYRLLGAKALESLTAFTERNLFLRGLVPLLGGKYLILRQTRKTRKAGNSKYNIGRMLSLAWDGVTSFSVAPLRLMLLVGGLVFSASIFMSLYVLWGRFLGDYVPGWASTALPIYIFGGIQLLGIGLIGEYLGKIYIEVKQRPRFVAEKKLK